MAHRATNSIHRVLNGLINGQTAASPRTDTATTLLQLLIRAAPNLSVHSSHLLDIVIYNYPACKRVRVLKFIMFVVHVHIIPTSGEDRLEEVSSSGKDSSS
jgi:hypothetical protein